MNESFRFILDVADELVRMQRTIDFWHPAPAVVAGVPLPSWTAPSIALGALLSLIVLSGVAVGSLGVLIAALLLGQLLLEQVLGIELVPA